MRQASSTRQESQYPELAFLDPPSPEFPNDLGTFDRYRIVEQIGQGGMGLVFRAIDPMLKRTVALKVILPKYASNSKLRERFLEEARATAAVRSPHVAEVYDCGIWKDAPYLTMELLVGVTLDKKPKPMPTDAWRRIGYVIAKGLADAHRSGMIHRDLKPSNIHLGTDARTGKPTVKLIDFGLARQVDRASEITKSGELLGTPAYMSPEQARGGKVDARTDLYSLGVILHQLATGNLPYPSASEGVYAILTELATADPLPSVTNSTTELPPLLASLIDRLLAKDREQRPASADEVMQILKQSVGTEKVTASTEVVASAPYISISEAAVPEAPFEDLTTEPSTRSFTPKRRKGGAGMWYLCLGVLFLGVLFALVSGVFKRQSKYGEEIAFAKPMSVAEPMLSFKIVSEELVQNGTCDEPDYRGWIVARGRWVASKGFDPYFRPGVCADAVMVQKIDVSRFAKEIDAGALEFKLSGLIMCYGGKAQRDKARLRMGFFDGNGKELAVGYDSGLVYEPGAWKEYGATRKPSVGTRVVHIGLHSERSNSPGNQQNSGYFDTISLKAITPKPPVLPSEELVLNGTCETASLEGWKILKGNWYKSVAPGSKLFCAGDCQDGILYQDIDVSPYAGAIDAEQLQFQVSVQFSSFDADTSQLKMHFLDRDNTQLSGGYDTGERAHWKVWVPYSNTTPPPTGTRFVRIVLRSRLVPRPGNKHNTGYFNDVSLKAVAR